MTVKFIQDAPHTARPNSTKQFKAGQAYVLSNEYAKEFIEAGAAIPVEVAESPEDLKPVKKPRTKK